MSVAQFSHHSLFGLYPQIEPMHSSQSVPAAPCNEVGDWVKPALIALDRIRLLPVGWDANHGPRVTRDALQTAIAIIYAGRRHTIPHVNVSPVVGGGIGLHFTSERREIDVEILPGGGVEYLLVERPTDPEEEECVVEGELATDQVAAFDRFFRWLDIPTRV